MHISFDELKEMSGYAQPSAVRAWLESNEIPYVLNKDAQPVTTQRALDEALLAKIGPGTVRYEYKHVTDVPNYDTH